MNAPDYFLSFPIPQPMMIKVSSSSPNKISMSCLENQIEGAHGSLVIIRNRAVQASLSSTVPNGSMIAEVKGDEKPIVVIDNYESFTCNLCQVRLEIQAFHSRLFWNLGPQYQISAFLWVCNALEKHMDYGGKPVRDPTGVVQGKSSLVS